jgi:uncharacterized protein YegL
MRRTHYNQYRANRARYNRHRASIDAQEKALTPVTDAQALNYAKEKRFTLSASLLADKPTQVRVINNEGAPPAAYNPSTKNIMLNEAWPKTDNEVTRLIFNRANLYHEVDHALFTKGDAKRRKLAEQSKDRDTFLAVSNILEDGRIEWLGKQKFPGSGDFLDSVLVEATKLWKADNKIEGLICYSRTTMFRNQTDADYWQPYKAKIDKAIRALTTSAMLDIAFELSEAISPDKPKQPEQPQQGDAQNEPQNGDEGEQGEGDSQTQQDKSESQNEEQGETSNDSDANDEGDESENGANGKSDDNDEAEGDEGQGDSESDEDSGSEGEGEQSESEDEASDEQSESTSASNSKRGDEKPSDIDGEVWEKIKQIAAQAMSNVKDVAKADLQAILDEAETYEPEQGYASGEESGSADELASIFASLAVESARTRYQSSRAGLLNSASLASALTDRRCFHKREDTPSVPNVVLLLDTSSSMDNSASALTSAARVLNGALRKAKVNVKVITFGGSGHDVARCLKEFKTLPVDAPLLTDGGTPTGEAMRAANDWLETQASTRGLVIVATDGQPNNASMVADEVQRAEQANGYVVGVLIGIDAAQIQAQDEAVKAHETAMAKAGLLMPSRRASNSDTLCKQFHEFAFCPNIAELANIIQPMLASYLAGS